MVDAHVIIFLASIFIQKKNCGEKLWNRDYCGQSRCLQSIGGVSPFRSRATVHDLSRNRSTEIGFAFYRSFSVGLQSAIAKRRCTTPDEKIEYRYEIPHLSLTLVRNVRFYLLARNIIGLRSRDTTNRI